MRLKSFDNLLIALMSFVACLCLYMLYGVKYFSPNLSGQISIAQITDQVNTVKRKKDFYQSWMDADVGEGLSQNDEIYTHGQSSAKIHFNNGPEVQLYENSLLRIKSHTVSLEKGNLTARLTPDAKSLDVLMNGKKYSIESSGANVQIEQGKSENKFVITDGDARLKVGEKAEVLKPNQVLIQNKESGEIKVKEIPFVLKAPASGFISYFSNEKRVRFEWTLRDESKGPVTLLIAKDSAFEKIVLKETVEEKEFTKSFMQEGTYFWKILSNDDISSPLRSFTLKAERPLTLQLDKDILYKGPKKDVTATLHWSKGDARRYELKIDGEKTETIDLDQNFYEFKAAKTGTVKFQVKVKDDNRPEALWSSPAELSVLEAKSISIQSALPETLEKINYTGKETTQLLAWSGPGSGITYTIKLKANDEEKTYTSETSSFPLSLTSAGDYTWSVQGETESGVLTNVIGGKIILKAPVRIAQAPSEGAVIELEKPDQTVSFKWDNTAGSDTVYEFELSDDSSFGKVLLTKESQTNGLSTTVGQTGRYFWRVKIKKGGKTEYSSPVSVEIRPTPPLSRPDITPNIKIKMKVLEEKSSSFHFWDFFLSRAFADEPVAVAEWDVPANNRAKTYIVEVYEDKDLTRLLTKIESTSPHIVWKKAKSGIFFWRMSYEDFWGRRTEFSKVATLETSIDEDLIKKPEAEILPPPPIELSSPKHKDSVLEMEEDSIDFSWETIPDIKTYLFTIARDLDFKETVFTKKINKTKITLHCEDLNSTEGEFYWKVTAENGSSSKRRMIKTECKKKIVEEVKAPEVTTSQVNPEPAVYTPPTLLRAGLSPHHLSYSNKATNYSVDVSGNVLNSLNVFFQRKITFSKFTLLSADIQLMRGKVFNQFTFTDADINLRFHIVKDRLHYGPVLSLSKKTLYEEVSLAVKDKSQMSPLIGAFLRYDFQKAQALAEVKFAGAMDFSAETLFEVNRKISAGPFIHLTSLSKEGGKHQFTAFGIKLTYAFLFDESK